MIPLGTLDQIYIMSMLVGGAFIAINLFIGNFGEGPDGGGGDASTTNGDDFGAADSGSGADAGGADTSGAETSGAETSGDDFGAANSGGKLISAGVARATIFGGVHNQSVSMHSAPLLPRLSSRLGMLVLGLLSPMSIALFLCFFGVFGMVVAKLLPWLGVFSVLPAVLGSMGVTQIFKGIIRYLIVHGGVSTEAKVEELVGHMATVNTPISDGRPGEVTYEIGSKRYQAAAKPIKAGVEFKRGSKVWIVEVRDHLLMVDSCSEIEIEELMPKDNKVRS
jgi:membrane protein implicated in regulation of membrane protease activity